MQVQRNNRLGTVMVLAIVRGLHTGAASVRNQRQPRRHNLRAQADAPVLCFLFRHARYAEARSETTGRHAQTTGV